MTLYGENGCIDILNCDSITAEFNALTGWWTVSKSFHGIVNDAYKTEDLKIVPTRVAKRKITWPYAAAALFGQQSAEVKIEVTTQPFVPNSMADRLAAAENALIEAHHQIMELSFNQVPTLHSTHSLPQRNCYECFRESNALDEAAADRYSALAQRIRESQEAKMLPLGTVFEFCNDAVERAEANARPNL